ncbi:MAG TPA: nucleoside-diphosphate kinase [Tissierellaceae bacterium]|nr:nucleoside-diphosphate kinase [Tissierellaceae bacterium]
MEKTFIMIKPDGVKRGLMGEVISKIEKKGYKILRAKLFKPSEELVKEHYIEHKEKSFYKELVTSIAGKNVMAMEVEGEKVIEVMRLIIGDKDPVLANPGTLRGDFANTMTENIVHGSDSLESSKRELKLWFSE